MTPDSVRNLQRYSLRPLNKWTPQAENMALMISAHESFLGKHLKQIGGGPARGLYGMECGRTKSGKHRTEIDIWENYLRYKKGLVEQIEAICGVTGPEPLQVQYNHIYSTIMCRLKLLMCPGNLPSDIDEMAEYCSKYYNAGGAGTPEKYKADYLRLVINA